MRKLGPPSEIRRLVAPLAQLFDGAWQRMHWWVATLVMLYAVSGITVVKPDEAAVILRWGHLVGDTPALQEHGSGLLFAFPKPIDQVVRVQVKRVREIHVSTLNSSSYGNREYVDGTLDPLKQGYALTGDRNVVHVEMVARYRIRDAAEWAFYGPQAENVLRVEVTSAMVRSLGEMGIDRVLADGRKDLIEAATHRAQAGLDSAHSGLELSSLELTRLSPPVSLAGEFDAVQSAFIGAQTKENEAKAYVQSAIPGAHAEADAAVQAATGKAESDFAAAKGETEAFISLHREYRVNPAVVRERLYRDAVDRSIAAAGTVRWIPPPVGDKYHGFRITLSPSGAPREAPDSLTDSISNGSPSSATSGSAESPTPEEEEGDTQ